MAERSLSRTSETENPTTARRRPTFGSILSWLIIALIAAIVAAVVLVPRLMGATPLAVLTGSMQPTYHPGDIVVVRPTPVDDLQIGDVVTFNAVSGDPTFTTHRIVNIADQDGQLRITTRGDANNVDDAPILPDQIHGRVIYSLPLIGYLTTPRAAFLAGGLLLGGGFLLYAANNLILQARAQKQTTETPNTQDQLI